MLIFVHNSKCSGAIVLIISGIFFLLLVKIDKPNFFKLLELMQYKCKKTKGEKEETFIYQTKYKKNNERKNLKKDSKNSPFDKLSELRFI